MSPFSISCTIQLTPLWTELPSPCRAQYCSSQQRSIRAAPLSRPTQPSQRLPPRTLLYSLRWIFRPVSHEKPFIVRWALHSSYNTQGSPCAYPTPAHIKFCIWVRASLLHDCQSFRLRQKSGCACFGSTCFACSCSRMASAAACVAATSNVAFALTMASETPPCGDVAATVVADICLSSGAHAS